MKLGTRLERLEAPAKERCAKAWADFFEAVERHNSAAAEARALRLVREGGDPHPHLEAACDALQERLGVRAFETWCDAWEIPDPDRYDYRTPHASLPPPEEPPGAYEELLTLSERDGVEGDAAALILFWLCVAREVRACQGGG